MQNQRLVKLALASDLVTEMDTYINKSSSYGGRQDFVTDAIANLLADLGVTGRVSGTLDRESHDVRAASAGGLTGATITLQTSLQPMSEPHDPLESDIVFRPIVPLSASMASTLTGITYPAEGVLYTVRPMAPPAEPIWGIHNRDFPTLWAAGLLSRELETKEFVSYDSWLSDTTELAWRFAHSIGKSDLDLSGFPMNRAKAEKSEARFIRFFVGDELGRGPLFELSIAARTPNGDVALTAQGASLLQKIEGWSPTIHGRPDDGIRHAFLAHLASWVPADFDFLQLIVGLIASGVASRDGLVSQVGEIHRDWSGQVAATNVAGFIGRARQWGIVERKQENRMYSLAPGGAAALDDVADFRREE